MRRSTHFVGASWALCLLAAILVTALPVAWSPLAQPALAAAAAPSRLLNLDFVDAEVTDVLTALSKQSGANIVASGSVKEKKVTVRLHQVSLEQALALVTRPNGLDYRLVDGAYVVAPAGELDTTQGPGGESVSVSLKYLTVEDAKAVVTTAVPGVAVGGQAKGNLVVLVGSSAAVAQAQQLLEAADQPGPMSSEVVQLKFLRVEDVKKMMASALPKVKVEPGAGTSALLTGPSRDLAKALMLVKAADTQPGAGYESMQVYNIKFGDADELAKAVSTLVSDVKVIPGPRTGTPELMDPSGTGAGASSVLKGPAMSAGSGGGYGSSGSSGGTSGTRTQLELAPVTNLLVSGPELSVRRAMELLAQLDIMPNQLAISALVVDIDDSVVDNLGIEWGDLGTGIGLTLQEQPADSFTNIEGLKLGKFMRNTLSLSSAIRALESINKARILSNPTVATMEGRMATIHSGETVYYPKLIGYDTLGKAIYDVEQIPTGVTLIINPWLNPDGQITLTLQPIVSSIKPGPFSVGGVIYPLVQERRTMTTVRVKQGETLIIGGLVQNQVLETSSRVPILSKIPIIGKYLFSYRSKQPRRSEVMIFITPRQVGSRPAIEDLKSKAME